MDDVTNYYNSGFESERLLNGEGILEFDRSKAIINRYLNGEELDIYDVGGGDGIYSRWLAEQGHQVHLFDLSQKLIDYARNLNIISPLIQTICLADARSLPVANDSCDIIILFGPLYHLQQRVDRLIALKEAARALRPGGLIFVSAISRFGSFFKAMRSYGIKYNTLAEKDFQEMLLKEIESGIHDRPKKYPTFLPSSYFHEPVELEVEISESGLQVMETVSIEGPFWLNENIINNWTDEKEKMNLLISSLEKDKSLMATSLHFMSIAKKC